VPEKFRENFWSAASMKVTDWDRDSGVTDDNMGLAMVKQIARAGMLAHDAATAAAVGQAAPDPVVHRMDGSECQLVSDLSQPGRPLVLNFGSCTCALPQSQCALSAGPAGVS
jgi:hypothetical protein